MRLALVLCALFANACVSTIELNAEYTPVGAQGTAHREQPTVASPHEVRVYYKSSPPGFTLGENELEVEPGFDHRILGELKVRGDGTVNDCGGEGSPGQKDVFAKLQAVAHAVGANAVIYAYSEVAQTGRFMDCRNALERNEFGGGWAVVVSAEHLTPVPPGNPTGGDPRPISAECAEWQKRISAAPNGRPKADIIRRTPPECLTAR